MLLQLRAKTEATTGELVAALGLSAPTVRAAAQMLRGRELIEPLAAETGRPGRPTPRLRFRAESRAFVGVNIDDIETVIRVAGLDGRQVGESRVPSHGRPWDLASGARSIREAVRGILPSASIAAMALAVPAWVERDGTMRESPAMPELNGVPLRRALEDVFGCPALVENDLQLAALAEHRFGAARETSTFVYLWAGARVSSAVFIDGHLHRGATGIAGAVGSHNRMEWGAAPLMRPTAAQFAAARDASADSTSRRVVQRYVDALSSGLSALTLALDPEVIVLAAHRPDDAVLLSGLLSDAVHRDTFIARPRVVPAAVGVDSRVLGALCLATEVGERRVLGLDRRIVRSG